MKRINITKRKRMTTLLIAIMVLEAMLSGCSAQKVEESKEDTYDENVIITETGQVIENEEDGQAAEPTESQMQESNSDLETQTYVEKLEEPEQEQVITDEDQIEPKGYELQLVFLGDSIFDNSRDGTGVPYLTAVECNADVYNLAIGGTSATLEYGEELDSEHWTSRSLQGVVKAMQGKISTDIFEGTRTKEILDNPNIDFSQTDYFIVEYGINDFFRAVPLNDSDDGLNRYTYAGALRCALGDLRKLAPDATIIVCSPHYAQFYNGDWMIGDGNTLNTGYGTLFDYKGTCEYVTKEDQSIFFNAYQDLGINGYTADEYLEDGVHLTEAGRQLYADALAEIILNYEETKNN